MGEFQTAFNDADMVFVAPVYAAGEAPIEGIDAQALVDGLKRRGHRSAAGVADADALAVWLAETIQPGDLVCCLGAGDVPTLGGATWRERVCQYGSVSGVSASLHKKSTRGSAA